MKNTIPLMAALALPLLNGCLSMAPDYRRPEAPVSTNWPSGPAYPELTSENSPAAAALHWQEFYTDDRLKQLITQALENNRDLRLAILNVERARALYGVQRSQLFPSINATAAGAKQQRSADLISPDDPRTIENYGVNLGIAAWEIDLFGRIQSLKEEALENYLATEEARRAAEIALVAEVASAYLTLAADQSSLELAQSTLAAQQHAHSIIQVQYNAELATEIDLRRALTQVDAARVDVARYTQRTAQDRNALTLLLGTPIPENLLPPNLANVPATQPIAPGIPSQVLLSRPDIIASEHRLKAANALIGAARAAFFPRISLTAAFGTASGELNRLFADGTEAWNFSPSIILPIFDPRVWAANRVSRSQQQIALTEYEKAIQTAFREVTDSLAVRGTIAEQVAAQQAVVDSAQTIYHLAEKRYNGGVDSYLSVLDAQRTLYGAQQGLITLQQLEQANAVRLYAVLGGGTATPTNAP